MKHKLSIFAVLVMAMAIPPSAFAYDFSAVAPTGQTLYYNIVDGNAQVTSENSSNPYYSTYPTGALEIPATVTNGSTTYSVTSIGQRAFYYCYGLTSVTIPNSVTSIGDGAFSSCSGLTSITIPNSVTSIGDHAFYGCSSLTSVTIPISVTSIGESAFSENRHIEYHGTATGAPWGAISMNGVTDGDLVYSNSSKDTLIGYIGTGGDVSIPNSVTTIGDLVFYYCSGLTSVTIPNSVTSIGDEAFAGCSGLTSVTIPNSIDTIGDYAFYGCSGLTTVTIPNSITFIGEETFAHCIGLTSVTIPNSVTSIGDHAFQGCSGLTSVIIPNSVTTISERAFIGCSNLIAVTIPESVTYIGSSPFAACDMLASITVESGNTHYDSRNNSNAIIETSTNTLIASCKNTVIPNSVTSIGNSAFYNCKGLTSIAIPNSVTSIGYSAFLACPNLTSVTIPNSVTSIDGSAFQNCNGLTSVTISESVTIIGGLAFAGCSGLTEIHSLASTPPGLSFSVFESVPTNIPVYVPCGSVAAYQAANGWNNFTNIQCQTDIFIVTLTAESNDSLSGTVTGGGIYAVGDTVTITAVPNCGYLFTQWDDGISDNPRSLVIEGETSILALFESNPNTPTASSFSVSALNPYPELHICDSAGIQMSDSINFDGNSVILTAEPYIPVQFFNGIYLVEEIPYHPADTTFSLGTRMSNGTDDVFASTHTSIPFPFYFFGIRKNQFRIGANGLVTFCSPSSFGSGNYCPYSLRSANNQLPWNGTSGHAVPGGDTYANRMRDAIYGVYEDTDPAYFVGSETNRIDGIYYGVQDQFPCRKIICSWKEAPDFSSHDNKGTYQIVCYEGTNIIEVHVKRRSCCPTTSDALIGIQNATGKPQITSTDTNATNSHVVCGSPAAFWPEGYNVTTSSFDNKSFRFTPQGTRQFSANWYRLLDDCRGAVLIGTNPEDTNGYCTPINLDDTLHPSFTSLTVHPTTTSRYMLKVSFLDAESNVYTLYDTVVVIVPTYEVTSLSSNDTLGTVFGGGSYFEGSNATLMAIPSQDHAFRGWDNGESSNPYSLPVLRDTTVTALFSPTVIDTAFLYDTTYITIHDTVTTVDTLIYRYFQYDTVVLNTSHTNYPIVNLFQYDTTMMFDTVIVNIYNYDTSIYNYQYDTMIINIYQYDTTLVNYYDTIINNYYQHDTTFVYDTIINNYYQYDTTIFSTHDSVIVNHYFHDTTYIYINNNYHDTVFVYSYVHDTVIDYINHYVFDTTYLYVYVHDTLYMTRYIFDTTGVGPYVGRYLDSLMHDSTYLGQNILDSLIQYIDNHLPDTVTLWDTLTLTVVQHDTVYIHDTIYIQQEGIDDPVTMDVKLYQRDGMIVVEGAEGFDVTAFDAVGRMVSGKRREDNGKVIFDVRTSGVYLVKIGDAPARRIVVIR